jgi:hypothetical protein
MPIVTGTATGILHQMITAAAIISAATAAAIQTNFFADARSLTGNMPALLESDTASRAKAMSCADWKRCSGFFSRHRCTTRCKLEGTLGLICEILGGSSCRIALIVSAEVSFPNARLRVSIS